MKAWAIIGSHGLYYGTASTRKEAIAQHVYAFNTELYQRGFPDYTPALSTLQKTVWKQCRKRGDEAVKVTVEVAQ